MKLHPSTFEYLKPTDMQVRQMAGLRSAFATFTEIVSSTLPDGPDKTYVIRHLREASMWANIALTREADGTPKTNPAPGNPSPAG